MRTFNNSDTITTRANESVRKTFGEAGIYIVNAKAYYADELKAIASTTIQHSSRAEFASLSIEESSLQTPTKVTLNLIGRRTQDIQNISRDRGDGEITYSKNLTVQHQYTTSGIKTLQQTLIFNDGTRLTNIVTFNVTNPFAAQSIALNITGALTYDLTQATNLSLAGIPRTLPAPISVINTFGNNQYQRLAHTPLSQIRLQYTYTNAGSKAIASIAEVNRCISVFNQGTVYINTIEDICLKALKN